MNGLDQPRRSRSPRRTKSSVLSSSNIGSVDALNKIMRVDNKLSQSMRQSIMIAAVLARKRKDTYTQFLGSDGRTYPDLRAAFGKHIGIKQCELCKQRVQGAFYCRITHEHLDVPDYDGDSSHECLLDLFKCSVDDLVQRQQELHGGGEVSRKRKAVEPNPSVSQSSDDAIASMDEMNEEVLLQIALYIPKFKDLISFCKTSKRMQTLLCTPIHSEALFRGSFLQTFGKMGMVGNFEMNLSWRERWRMICGLRRGLVYQRPSDVLSLNDGNENLHRPRQTIGVLSREEEHSALFYDNPDWNFTDGNSSNGYFGIQVLHLSPPPNAANDWQPPLVCTGDFNGIKIFNSVEAMFQNSRHRFVSLGDEEGGGQVLTLIQCDPEITEGTNRSEPCFFIGFASGRVAAVNATIAECGQKYNFCISDFQDSHDQEVTSLVIANSIAPDSKRDRFLYSACGGGQVYCYPNALRAEDNFSMNAPILAFTSDCPIFSMTSIAVDTGDHCFSIICTGDREGRIRLWKWKRPDDDEGLFARHYMTRFAGSRVGLVTAMKFVNDELLVTCTNNGDVRIWKLQCCGERPQLELKYDKMNLHAGAVEVIMNVGSILLTSGGDDGKVTAIDLNTGLILQRKDCHTGERIQLNGGSTILAKSAVVAIILSGKEGCMTSLCRDGTLQQWNFVNTNN